MNINEKIKLWREQAPTRKRTIESQIMFTLRHDIEYVETKIQDAIYTTEKNVVVVMLYPVAYKHLRKHFAPHGIKIRRTILDYLFYWIEYMAVGGLARYKAKVNFKNA
jgi:hypothetical protein